MNLGRSWIESWMRDMAFMFKCYLNDLKALGTTYLGINKTFYYNERFES